jgi:signal transduction histidine kinase/CheY-like chemotaxis protein
MEPLSPVLTEESESLSAMKARAEPLPGRSAGVSSTPRVNILLVDDQPGNLLALQALLDDLGQNLVLARSGREALRCLLHDDFALILLDVQMPDMDGLETAALVRQRDRTRHVPIIFLTGHERTDLQMFQGYSLGAVDYLTKPIVPQVLRSKVAVFVELHLKTEELRRNQQREHERRLAEERQRWEMERLRREAEREKKIAEELAATVAERMRAEEKLAQLKDELAAGLADMTHLHRFSARLSATLEMPAVLQEVLSAVTQLWHAEQGVLLLFDRERGDLVPMLAVGLGDDYLRDLGRVRRGDGFCGAVLERRRMVMVEDVEKLTAEDAEGRREEKARQEGQENSSSAPFSSPPRPSASSAVSFSAEERAAARRAGFRAACATPLLTRGGAVIGVVAAHFDRPRRPGEREVRLVELYARQAAEAIDNARLYGEIQDANRGKDEFLAMLAHELRNPLAPVLHALHVLRCGAADPADDEQAREMIDRQVRHMARLIDDLLDVSRITRGKIQLRPERVELAAVVGRAVDSTRSLIEARGHRLEVALPPEPVRLFADPTRLEQVLANLLNNSAKYTEPGGRIWLSAESEGGEVVLQVRDTGIGIPPHMLGRVFDLFMQAHPTLDRAEGGLGIGLTLVRRLVEMHGGRVEVRSDGPGKGSTFTVRMPLTEGGALAPASEEAPAEPPAPPPKHVLVVDDNRDAAEMLTLMLRLDGHEVRVAHDGAEALREVRDWTPEVVLLDIGLPGMSGYEVARHLLGGNGAPRPLLVAMTGYGQDEDRRRSREAGFTHHLVKPVDPQELRQLLARS